MLRAVVIKLEYASEIALLKMQVEGCVPWNAAPQTSSPALLGQGNGAKGFSRCGPAHLGREAAGHRALVGVLPSMR